MWDVDPNEKKLSYIPERVEGSVTGPESYLFLRGGRSKYMEQEITAHPMH